MLETLLAVAKNILAYIAEVDIQLAVIAVRVRQPRVHQPELNIFDVRPLKVRVVKSAHDSTPALLRVRQFTIVGNLRRTDVIRAALFGIETEVQQAQSHILIRGSLSLRRINLFLQHNTGAVVTKRVQIVLDVRRRIRLRIAENRVHMEPVYQRPVAVV